jgi:hypothetical protein
MRYTKEHFPDSIAKESIPNPRMPFHRCYRPMVQRVNSGSSEYHYLQDDDYAEKPYMFTRAFEELQNDLKEVFNFVEPTYNNRKTYSYKIQQLFIRVCIELEANFKAILKENKYAKDESKWYINDYWKIDASHKLSEYSVIMPTWEGKGKVFTPFAAWKSSPVLNWYRAYQRTKHSRAAKLNEANLENLMNAFCGLFVVLSAQFKTCDYSTGPVVFTYGGSSTYFGGGFGIGGMLKIVFPEWAEDEKYDVQWCDVYDKPDRFRRFDYDAVEDYVKA